MAFNVLHTFQKNKRFWMAAILMVSMITFVFCTGMGKGDMADRIGYWLGGRRGAAVVIVANQNVSHTELSNLKDQRNVANEFMRNCTEIAFKRVSKSLFEEKRKTDQKDDVARRQMLTELFRAQQTLYDRKSRPRYFDIGVKFDDLVEFKLWQAVADKLDIYLDDAHVAALFRFEFEYFRKTVLDENDIARAQMEVRRNHQNASDSYVRRALTEEFRVRIAQEAVLLAQPYQLYSMSRQGQGQDFGSKLTEAEFPDEVRAPMTLAQIWDTYKTLRGEFNITLVPVSVDALVKNIKDEPTEGQKAEYFRTHNDKLNDPSAEERGIQLPISVKIDYVMADPNSKEYLGLAKTLAQLKTINPIHLGAIQSPLADAASAMAQAQMHRDEVAKQYGLSSRPTDTFDYRATPFSTSGAATPIMTWLAKRHPQAIASMIGNGFAGPGHDAGSMAGFMAWGVLKDPETLQASMKTEGERRSPFYAAITAIAGAEPLAAIAPSYLLDFVQPALPVETVQHEIEDILARNEAVERAQQNMQTLRAALTKADGDEQKYKRVLTKLVPELHLTYGPKDKSTYFNRFTVNDAKELEPLREAYLKYMDRVNFFEGRDLTPERILKQRDFQKLFFDSSESFAATTTYHAMPWPPKAKTSNTRVLKPFADPRLIDPTNLEGKDFANFQQQLGQVDPLRPAAEFDMFKHAEKPILFWRTAERIPIRPTEYSEIDQNLKKYAADSAKIDHDAKHLEEVTARLAKLRKQQADLRKAKGKEEELAKVNKEATTVATELRKLESAAGGPAVALRARQLDWKEKISELQDTKRLIVAGWKFDQARAKALPEAEKIALEFYKDQPKTKTEIADAEATRLKEKRIVLPNLSSLHPDRLPDGSVDYFKQPLPKDTIPFARDDMMDQAVRLYDLKEPIKIGYKELDDINKVLYDKARSKKNPQGEFVQILTNKPRSVYYVAVVSATPHPEMFGFAFAMRGADSFLVTGNQRPNDRLFPRDHFVQRVQQKDGKAFRASVIAYFKSASSPLGKFEIVKEDIKKDFDERGGGD